MNANFKKYKDDFIDNNFYDMGCEVTHEEYQKSEDKEMYAYHDTGNEQKYYKKEVIELSDEELALGIKIRNYDVNKKMNNNIDTIKKIMIFWLVLTIVNIIGVFYIVSKIANISNIAQ